MKYAIAFLAAAFLTACSSLHPFPPPDKNTCAVDGNLTALWSCIGVPDPRPRESGLRSTERLATGDLTRRILIDQTPSLACNRTPREGFEHVSENAGGAPLEAFVHAGERGRPVIFVIHGLYDSNSNRYIRYIASALAEQGFGVVVPDMRWHGCLFALPNTLGINEASDLISWASAIRFSKMKSAVFVSMADRPIGMIGFSLGALDVINAAARDEARSLFDVGAIAVSPPAAIPTIRMTLDDVGSPMGLYFRTMLRLRNRRLGIPFWTRQPFKAYIDHIAATDVPQFGNSDRLMEAVEPTMRLRDVRRPLLVLAARNDPVLSQGAADALAQAAQSLPYVHVIETDEGGHVGIIGRDPQWFANAMAMFFDHAKDVPPRP